MDQRRAPLEPRLVDLLVRRRGRPDAGETDFSETAVGDGLLRWLRAERRAETRIEGVTRLAGGGSNALYAFTLCSGEERERLVLRLRLAGSGELNPVAREYQMMGAGGSFMPVPVLRWQTDDRAFFGAPALVTEFANGVQGLGDQPTRASGMGTTYPPAHRRMLGRQFVDFVADLHAADPADHDLSAFELPRHRTTDAIDWRLAFWDEVWSQDSIEPHPTMCLAREWLWEHRPTADRISLLHGDYRNGNFLFDPATGRVTAVLDWELATLGDRHADLAYTMFRSFGHVIDGRFHIGGLVPRDEFIARYEARSGLDVDPVRLRYYSIFNMYWSNVWMLGIGLHGARTGRSQLDVMCQVMTGQAVASLDALNHLLHKDSR